MDGFSQLLDAVGRQNILAGGTFVGGIVVRSLWSRVCRWRSQTPSLQCLSFCEAIRQSGELSEDAIQVEYANMRLFIRPSDSSIRMLICTTRAPLREEAVNKLFSKVDRKALIDAARDRQELLESALLRGIKVLAATIR